MSLNYDLYLDTSVINFLFADDAPEKKAITLDFFDNFIKPKKYNAYISDFVIEEINNTEEKGKRERLFDAIKRYPMQLLPKENQEAVEDLANKYIEAGVVPKKKVVDALHIVMSTVFRVHYLVSWNYKHLANVNREQKVRQVNIANHYFNELRIVTPLELIDYGI